ncbi:MAG: hypothetical protein Q4P07_02300 [Ornithinimicrobium sp.]|uniref:hypothetical protein n=1 Tax=Ornithinimicrobium sp. TaxID=1977084 RepID=UPI0026E02F58|nr:hypothetical protein [Ornithinimicrobium sp.]MDO5738958.1 hypothetical protein [Ornithinimicrobium sp.]
MRRRPLLSPDVRSVVVPLGLGTIGTGALLFFIGSLRYTVLEAALVVLLAAVVISLAPLVLTRSGRYAERAYWASTPRQESVPPAALDYRLVRLRRDLRDAVERDDRTDEIYPLLRDLTSERLLALHGINIESDPEGAKAAMDPHLWRYLTHPPTDDRRRSRGALHTALEGIEKI